MRSRPTRAAWIETSSQRGQAIPLACRGPHGPRGLKLRVCITGLETRSRGPHGPRGLKHSISGRFTELRKSRPTRAAWIETRIVATRIQSPRRRGPHGPRGLKRYMVLDWIAIVGSRPTRAAWIETLTRNPMVGWHGSRGPHGPRGLKLLLFLTAPIPGYCRGPHGPRGLKRSLSERQAECAPSRPTRAAWIETPQPCT